MKEKIKKILKMIGIKVLKLIIILIIVIIFCITEAYIMTLLKLDNENMTNLIISLGFTLTILNLWDKIAPHKEDKTLENKSEIIIELLKNIEKNSNNQKLLKENIIMKEMKITEEKEYEEIK